MNPRGFDTLALSRRAHLAALPPFRPRIYRAAVGANEGADSSGECNELGEFLRWCHVAEGFAWSVVEAGCDAGQVLLGVNVEV